MHPRRFGVVLGKSGCDEGADGATASCFAKALNSPLDESPAS
jgi:hypothetical protein